MNFIVAAIPFFLLLIVIELIVDKHRGTGYYRFSDAMSSLSLGTFSRITGILTAAIPFSVYVWLYHNHAFWQLDDTSVWVWISAFIAYDLGYYWVHRLGHRVAIMWGSHVVHHSSEEYNLTTALRQTSTPSMFGWLIYLPLALLGISPTLLVACASLNLIYQFWVHTRHIDKLPQWYEAIFVTPSHHRVHHALNRDYIDKNFAGVFILWDKLFGSFQAEKPEVDIVYGVSGQLNSWNPVWANAVVYWQLVCDAWHTGSVVDKIKVFFKPPGFRPTDVNQQFPRKYATTKTLIKYDVALTNATKLYLLCHFVVLLALVFAFILQTANYSLALNTVICALATFNLLVVSAMQEQKQWAKWGEPVRLFATASALWLLIPEPSVTVSAMLLIGVFSSLVGFYRFPVITHQNKPASTEPQLNQEMAN